MGITDGSKVFVSLRIESLQECFTYCKKAGGGIGDLSPTADLRVPAFSIEEIRDTKCRYYGSSSVFREHHRTLLF
jgi:hypothetical protein